MKFSKSEIETMTDQEYLDAFRKNYPAWSAWSDEQVLTARDGYLAEKAHEEALKKVPCAYCGKPVPSVLVWKEVWNDDDYFQEADGKFFHTDCYGVYLIDQYKGK